MRKLLRYMALFLLVMTVGIDAQEGSTDVNDRQTKMKEVRRLLKSAKNHLEEGGAAGAVAAADSVTILDQANPDAAYYRALGHIVLGDTATAISGLEAALGSAPHSTRLRILLARLHLGQSRPAEAVELVDNILILRPNEGEALYLKGWAAAIVGDTLQALDLMQKAIEAELK